MKLLPHKGNFSGHCPIYACDYVDQYHANCIAHTRAVTYHAFPDFSAFTLSIITLHTILQATRNRIYYLLHIITLSVTSTTCKIQEGMNYTVIIDNKLTSFLIRLQSLSLATYCCSISPAACPFLLCAKSYNKDIECVSIVVPQAAKYGTFK